MSRVVIEDTGGFWILSSNGDIAWAGKINGQLDLEIVGPLTSATRNFVSIYTGSTTGYYYRVSDGTQLTYPGYDGLETFTRFGYLLVTFFFLWWLVRVVGSLLSNKNHNIT